jgi:small ligand-binding sensory domain FIST
MKIAAAASTLPDASAAATEAATRAAEELEGAAADFAFTFFSAEHAEQAEAIASVIREVLAPAALLGCTTEVVVGGGHEFEGGPAVAVWAANLPGASVETFVAGLQQMPDGEAIIGFPILGEPANAIVLVADPFTFPTQNFLSQLNEDHPKLPIIGGMCSGGAAPGQHALIEGARVVTSGAVGALIRGSVAVRTVVSQGCKPIGDPYSITAASGPVINQLAGRPPMARLQEAVRGLHEQDQALVGGGLHVGVVIDEYKSDLGPGDFLIRNVMGANRDTGALAVGDYISPGQTVQFHLRDSTAAGAELSHLLEKEKEALNGRKVAGVLMFTCNGRGTRFFGVADHDVTSVESHLGPLPVAGMFCAGEIGPVGGRNFIHGFTASLALFVE